MVRAARERMTAEMARCPRPVLLAILPWLALAAACSYDCSAYPDVPESNLRSSTAMLQSEVGPPLAYLELARGDGRPVTYGRKIGLRVAATSEDGAPLAAGEVLFLLPRAEPAGGAAYGLDSGEVPDELPPVLAGMQVGGRRRFVLPARRSGGTAPEPWRLRGIGASAAIEIPRDGAAILEVEVLSVCRPRICVMTTYSIPASRDRRMVERGCR
jgi:hypothetical protein